MNCPKCKQSELYPGISGLTAIMFCPKCGYFEKFDYFKHGNVLQEGVKPRNEC